MCHLEYSIIHKLEGEDGGSLLHQAVAVWGHRSGGDPSHISMVAARSHKEFDRSLPEHGCYYCDVRQVGPPGQLRVVGRQHIPRSQLLAPLPVMIPVLDLRMACAVR